MSEHSQLSALPTVERPSRTVTGWAALPVTVLLLLAGVLAFGRSLAAAGDGGSPSWPLLVLGLALVALGLVSIGGYFALQPNEARVLVLFGDYRGTCKQSGFHWANPFYSNASVGHGSTAEEGEGASTKAKRPGRLKVSLRARTLNGERLKVNDRRGNPIEIAAVVVWRVADTARAVFDVEDFVSYVATQSETALRHLASRYAYDHGETSDEEAQETTLRSDVEVVSEALRWELGQRLAQAGVVVEQARLTHLAYAPEIAQAMLRRQQADAVIAARRKIVIGAVSMVDMALHDLASKGLVALDDQQKAAMVGNLMVVLCGESEVRPVVNTGTP
jgi:regulator of protease activity HflC (stomatin/prohibitin superfamily)